MRPRLLPTLILTSSLCLACGGPTAPKASEGITDDTSEDITDETDETTETTMDPNDPRAVLADRSERDEARQVGLSVIQSYFDNEPQAFIDLISDILPEIGREGDPMDGQFFRELVERSDPYPSGEDFTMYTMDQYHEVFDPLVVTYDEAVEHFGVSPVENDGWIPAPDDFIYFGGYLKPGRVEEDKFIRDGLNSFVFGKRDGVWMFVGFVS